MAAKMPQETLYSCEVCGLEGLADEDLRSHMLLVHLPGTTACPFCDLEDITAPEMVYHVNSAHLDYLSPQDEDLDDDLLMVTNGYGEHPETPVEARNGLDNRRVPLINIDNDDGDGYNANVSPAHGKGGNSRGSPSRAQLSLNLNQRGPQSAHPSQSPAGVTACPICGLQETSAQRLEEHVNRAHFDLTSPSFPAITPRQEVVLTCPLCMKQFESTPDLELHVNIQHKDILSPAKSEVCSPEDQVLEEEEEEEVGACPVCSRVGFTSQGDLAAHIDTHFSRTPSIVTPDEGGWERRLVTELEKQEKEVQRMREQQEFSLLRSLSNMQRAVYAGEMTVADYYERQIELKIAEKNGVDDARSCTKGLLGPVRVVSDGTNNVKATYLCTTVDHYGSTYGDRGWGCGYRNIQMLLSSLQHHTGYYARLFSGPNMMPSISQIQKLIEQAWRNGFDLQGCEQLGGKLSNTRKWIGATEVVTLLSSFRIKCQLIDCHRPTAPDGTHPELFGWCLDYFSSQAEFRPPIYLQHQGHSRTIIGVEQLGGTEGGVRLLVLDPSHSPAQVSQLLHTQTAPSAMRLLRKPLSSMRAKQYQMVVVAGLMQTEIEYKQSKVLQAAIRIPKD
ncbi:zinc finger-containing ubiquitin peptidase 1-like isoform X2 [Portunus trituberculatus]|uniref:zinc finger-containing ubiquitin peptidase 1-like isoform X2 n=1 Tax=Portunus trituberculatus TaxID=210409 RepID=UPI001E1D1DF6|nr:zinc finger-containing ubiquitin peptidase 1-like isoform X2 [Portunus trituberculatus]